MHISRLSSHAANIANPKVCVDECLLPFHAKTAERI